MRKINPEKKKYDKITVFPSNATLTNRNGNLCNEIVEKKKQIILKFTDRKNKKTKMKKNVVNAFLINPKICISIIILSFFLFFF